MSNTKSNTMSNTMSNTKFTYEESDININPITNDCVINKIDGLIDRGIIIRTAESCTGGGIANIITNRDGSSRIIDCCLVTYSPEVKQKLLGVIPELTTDEKIVSKETAESMNWGLQEFCKDFERKCEVYVSITGWIGSNPVETGYHAYFTLCNGDRTLMSTFKVNVKIGYGKQGKKEYLIFKILCEIMNFVKAVKAFSKEKK